MKRLFLALVLALVVTPVASAEIRSITPVDQDITGPVIFSCTAVGSGGQRCRKCYANYSGDGVSIKAYVCLYTTSSDSCKCKMGAGGSSCAEEGKCTYF